MTREPTDVKVQRIEPAYRQVASQLRGLILDGELSPGERLPNETELSGMFGVSRSTIREALRALSSHGLITTQRGVAGGSFIAHPEPADVAEYLQASVGLLSVSRIVSVDELLEARAALEVPAARLAAGRRTDEQLATMWAVVRDEEAALDAGFEGHRALHSAVLAAADSSLLELMARPLFTVLRTRFLRDRAPTTFWAEVCRDHRGLVERIAEGDEEGAGRLMAEHLDHLRETYLAIDSRSHPHPGRDTGRDTDRDTGRDTGVGGAT